MPQALSNTTRQQLVVTWKLCKLFAKELKYCEKLNRQLQIQLITEYFGKPCLFLDRTTTRKDDKIATLRKPNLTDGLLEERYMKTVEPIEGLMKSEVDLSVRTEKLNDKEAAIYRSTVSSMFYLGMKPQPDTSACQQVRLVLRLLIPLTING